MGRCTAHSKTTSGSFNTTNAISYTVLNGSVSNVGVSDIGNVARNLGDANGGRGGSRR